MNVLHCASMYLYYRIDISVFISFLSMHKYTYYSFVNASGCVSENIFRKCNDSLILMIMNQFYLNVSSVSLHGLPQLFDVIFSGKIALFVMNQICPER